MQREAKAIDLQGVGRLEWSNVGNWSNRWSDWDLHPEIRE